jgi:hypothetical protein
LLHGEFEPVHLAQNLGRKLGRQGRTLRRASSAVRVGGRTIEQTCRSPRAHAISVRSIASASIRSVLARRLRRFTAIEDGSTTWLRIPRASSRR